MRIRLKTTYAGPSGSCAAGGVIDLPDGEAYGIVEAGYGSQVEEPGVERATNAAPENAAGVANRAGGRGRGAKKV